MGQHQSIRKNTHGPHTGEIPDKLYFRIGEVARLCEVPAYVLRFWETEFPQLRPNKGGTGQRLYRRRDVEMALRVKTLLKDEGYTIPGARQVLKAEFRHKDDPQLPLLEAAPVVDLRQLKGLRRELEAIVTLLSRPAGKPMPTRAIHPIRAHKRPAASLDPAAASATPPHRPARISANEIPFDAPAPNLEDFTE